MSNTILANRLVRAVIPYLTKQILQRLETKNVWTTDIDCSFKRKRKKKARGNEGDEDSNPVVLPGSPHEERAATPPFEGYHSPSTLREEGLNGS